MLVTRDARYLGSTVLLTRGVTLAHTALPPDMLAHLSTDARPSPPTSSKLRCAPNPLFPSRRGWQVVRSHEVKDEGYEVEANGQLITVFSAPNYCDQMGNKGALLRFDSAGNYEVKQFVAVPHPPVRPMAYASGMGGMFGF